MTKLRCIVTGGAGFIGSHMVDRLLTEGYAVTVIDNYSTGRPRNLEHHKDNSALNIVEASVNDTAKIQEHFKNVEFVFHFAALADIVPSIQRPVEYHEANVNGTLGMLEACRAVGGVKKIIYAASSSCYGIPDFSPTPETAEIRPQYPYALTKWIAEEMILHWCKVYKQPAVALRIFNAYGPRSRTHGTYGAVFGVFLAQKLAGKPFTVVGDGTQTRDFVYVTDVVDAFLTAARSQFSGEVFNLGSGGTYSVNRLVELLGGKEIVNIPKRPGEPDSTFADVTKIQSKLGWKAKISFEQGVGKVLENINYWREAPVWTEEKIADATKEWFALLK